MRNCIVHSVALIVTLAYTAGSIAAEPGQKQVLDNLLAMDFTQLLEIPVEAASGIEQSLRDAPAAMVVVSAEDIRRRGYLSLDELFADLPGFDAMQMGGPQHLVAYQRGYRTPFMQRTLLMINGVVDNHLWSHAAQISRQYPLSTIKRVEVLYGPTSAVYGPNAFLGIINVITEDGGTLKDNEVRANASLQLGSYHARGGEASVQGRHGDWRYSLSGKLFSSDEAGLDNLAPWPFLTAEQLNNRDTWGAVLDLDHKKVKYGEYSDPTEDWGILGEASFRDVTFGVIAWDTREAYGPYYTADHVQPNAYWIHSARQYYVQHDYQATPKLAVKSQILYHENGLSGNWVEAIPDWNAGQEAYSYLSISDWNSQSHSWLFKQDYDYHLSDTLRLTGGLKYEAKELTKAFDLCSYWSGTLCSSGDSGNGPHDKGAGIFHSTDPHAIIAPGTLENMPTDNLAHTRDWGAYLQAMWQHGDWSWLGGARYDRNSRYGGTFNPRMSAIYRWSPHTTLKLLYGRAFQEPSPIMLWGGWIGRLGNPDLRPEKAENLEFIVMHQQQNWLHDVSLFTARYRDVVKETAENAGSRDILGLEYRGRFSYPNFIPSAPDLSGYFYYTYTQARSSLTYDQSESAWLDQESDLGDIAPHKINFGLDVPLDSHWHVNLRANYVSPRTLYSRNPLRAEGREAEAFTVLNLTLGYARKPFDVRFTVKNLLDTEYYYPGGEQADSGDDPSARSLGFRNSLMPAEGRSLWLNLRWELD